MSKKFPQLTPEWLKKNLPAVTETDDILKYASKAFKSIAPTLDKLDKDEAPELGDVNLLTETRDGLNKKSKPLLTHPWKDAKTKKIPNVLKELDTALSIAIKVAGSAEDKSKKMAMSANDMLTNINGRIRILNKRLEEGEQSRKALEAKLKSTAAFVSSTAAADQKVAKINEFKDLHKRLWTKAFDTKEWTSIWREARSMFEKANFPDTSKAKAPALKLVDEGGKALAKDIPIAEAFQKKCDEAIVKMTALLKAKK